MPRRTTACRRTRSRSTRCRMVQRSARWCCRRNTSPNPRTAIPVRSGKSTGACRDGPSATRVTASSAPPRPTRCSRSSPGRSIRSRATAGSTCPSSSKVGVARPTGWRARSPARRRGPRCSPRPSATARDAGAQGDRAACAESASASTSQSRSRGRSSQRGSLRHYAPAGSRFRASRVPSRSRYAMYRKVRRSLSMLAIIRGVTSPRSVARRRRIARRGTPAM